jgi:ABC-type glycerol-3-phosphate transport system substrate-binding protein
MVVTLDLWVPEELNPYGDGVAAEILAQRLDDFSQAFPELQVRVVVKKARGRGGLLDFLRTASVAAPTVMPDLIVLNTEDLRAATHAELLQPMDPFLPESLAADRFPFATALGSVGDQTMGVVIGATMQHAAYRPALLPNTPITWTDIISAPAPFIFPVAGPDGGITDAFLCQYLAAGGDLTDDEGNPDLDVILLADLLFFYEEAIASGVITSSVVMSLEDTASTWEVFQAGQSALAVVDSRQFLSAQDPELAPSPFPTRHGRSVTIAEGWAIGLVTSDPNRQGLATTLMEWLLAPEHLGPWMQNAAYLPGTLSALQRWNISADDRTMLEVLLEGAIPDIDPELRAVVGPPMQAAFEAVLEGRRRPSEAAADAVSAVRQ